MDAVLHIDERALRCSRCGEQHSDEVDACPECDDYDIPLWFHFWKRERAKMDGLQWRRSAVDCNPFLNY